MGDDEASKRGRPPRVRNADDMIEQRPSPERRKASAALDEARLRLVQGEIAIDSRPAAGTRIGVRVPLVCAKSARKALKEDETPVG